MVRSDLARFKRYAVKSVEADCWEWTAQRDPSGYGRFRVGSLRDGTRRSAYAHRWAYEHFVGPIPAEMQIDHLCRNRACVNPAHLEAVPGRVNVLRGVGFAATKARQLECVNGHPFTPQNTHIRPNGTRFCRACGRRRARRAEVA